MEVLDYSITTETLEYHCQDLTEAPSARREPGLARGAITPWFAQRWAANAQRRLLLLGGDQVGSPALCKQPIAEY